MNNENKYQYINKLPKEYHRIFWNIMIKAECNHFVEEPERLSKQDCKIIMRFLYKLFNEIRELQKENKQLKEENYKLNKELCDEKRKSYRNRKLYEGLIDEVVLPIIDEDALKQLTNLTYKDLKEELMKIYDKDIE